MRRNTHSGASFNSPEIASFVGLTLYSENFWGILQLESSNKHLGDGGSRKSAIISLPKPKVVLFEASEGRL